MKSRVVDHEESVPEYIDGFAYFLRYDAGEDLPVYYRRDKHGIEIPILDQNEIFREKKLPYLQVYPCSENGADSFHLLRAGWVPHGER